MQNTNNKVYGNSSTLKSWSEKWMHIFLDANEDFLLDRKVDSVFQDL